MANTTIKQRLPVFISSTSEDLIPYRESAQRVLSRLEQTVKGMEFFGSSPLKPLQVCLKNVSECKIFIAIIGMRYGSIEESSGKSFTQCEYEEAIRNDIPTLIYIIGEDCPVLPKFVDTGEKAVKLEEFKNILRTKHTVSFFSSPEDFSIKLTQDVLAVLDELGHAEDNTDIKQDIQRDFQQIFEKFLFRPMKYQAREGVLTVKVSDRPKSCANLKTNVTAGLGLTHGDAISVPVFVLDCEKKTPLTSSSYYLYGEKEAGDWIEEVDPGTIVSVKVRLSYLVTPEIKQYDGGSVIENVSYTNLILLEAPQ